MPILEIEIVMRPGELLHPDMASRLADAAGEVLRAAARTTWVKLRQLPSEHYAENLQGGPSDMFPVFVSILKAGDSPPPPAGEAERLVAAIAPICDRPSQHVHILYEPDARGRMAFGGRLVT